MDTTRTVLVLGATGGIGGAAAKALGRRGWRVRTLVRDAVAAARPADTPGSTPMEWREGDATRRADATSRGAEPSASSSPSACSDRYA